MLIVYNLGRLFGPAGRGKSFLERHYWIWFAVADSLKWIVHQRSANQTD